MQNAWIEKLQSLYNVTRVPLSLLDGDGNLVASFPEIPYEAVNFFATAVVLADFRAQGRDAAHPLVSFIDTMRLKVGRIGETPAGGGEVIAFTARNLRIKHPQQCSCYTRAASDIESALFFVH